MACDWSSASVLTLQLDALVFNVSCEPDDLLARLVVDFSLLPVLDLLLIDAQLQLPALGPVQQHSLTQVGRHQAIGLKCNLVSGKGMNIRQKNEYDAR